MRCGNPGQAHAAAGGVRRADRGGRGRHVRSPLPPLFRAGLLQAGIPRFRPAGGAAREIRSLTVRRPTPAPREIGGHAPVPSPECPRFFAVYVRMDYSAPLRLHSGAAGPRAGHVLGALPASARARGYRSLPGRRIRGRLSLHILISRHLDMPMVRVRPSAPARMRMPSFSTGFRAVRSRLPAWNSSWSRRRSSPFPNRPHSGLRFRLTARTIRR